MNVGDAHGWQFVRAQEEMYPRRVILVIVYRLVAPRCQQAAKLPPESRYTFARIRDVKKPRAESLRLLVEDIRAPPRQTNVEPQAVGQLGARPLEVAQERHQPSLRTADAQTREHLQ